MNTLIWTLFVQTGNIETYLLLKHIENDHEAYPYQGDEQHQEIASFTTKR